MASEQEKMSLVVKKPIGKNSVVNAVLLILSDIEMRPKLKNKIRDTNSPSIEKASSFMTWSHP